MRVCVCACVTSMFVCVNVCVNVGVFGEFCVFIRFIYPLRLLANMKFSFT